MFSLFTNRSIIRTALVLGCGAVASFNIAKAQTDISNRPISSLPTANIQPNIMLLMDTSTSMGFSHMPDELEEPVVKLPMGYKNPVCNSIYYNRGTTYQLPKGSDGNNLPIPDFSNAAYNYFINPAVGVNLATNFQAYDNATRSNQDPTAVDSPQAAYYFTYTGTEVLSYTSQPCTQVDSSVTSTGGNFATSGGGTWKKVIVGTSTGILRAPANNPTGTPTTDERDNFAIWYTYYRTRLLLTKSSLSLAFAPVTDRFRVGFVTSNPGAPVAATKFIALADFTPANKQNWYSKVFSQVAGGSSPMREGLARVGRYYGGKTDGINIAMGADPVQYACQKNFTLMTTDGYWNTAAETAGPVGLDGSTLVGQQDGDISITPRPLWDIGSTGLRAITDKSSTQSYASCNGGYALLTTSQTSQTISRILQSTSQMLRVSQQDLLSTTQKLGSTTQALRTTSQQQQTTSQTVESTNINLRSTNQILRSTIQYPYTDTPIGFTQGGYQTTISTLQNRRNTVQNLKSTSQNRQTQQKQTQSTSQIVKSTAYLTRSTSQIVKSTNQSFQTTSQPLKSTSQTVQFTSSPRQSTVQNLQSTSRTVQTRKSTLQSFSYSAATEQSTPSGNCTPIANQISCYTVPTGPTLAASCTPEAANAGNQWTQTTCSVTPVASCSGAEAFSCPVIATTAVPIATCTPSGPTSGNNYTTTTCPPPVTTNNVAVSSCTPSGANSANLWTTTTCPAPVTATTGVSSCTASSANSGNGWTTTTCPAPVVTTNVPVASCTASGANSGNGWTTTTCPAPVVTTNVPVASCTASGANSGNGWTTTTCPAPVVTTNVPVASCTASAANSGNSFTSTTCPSPVTTGPTVGACTPGTSAGLTTTCGSQVIATNDPVSSCAPSGPTSGNGWVTTTCPSPITTPPTAGVACTPGTVAGLTTTCGLTSAVTTGVSSCTAISANSGNGWTTTTCPGVATTTSVPVNSCTPSVARAGNSWTATTCSQNITTNEPILATCVVSGPTAANNRTSTTCPGAVTTGPIVGACTPAAATVFNSFTATICGTTGVINTVVASCVPNAGPTNVVICTPPGPPSTGFTNGPCVNAVAGPGNVYTGRVCATPVVTTAQPAAACTVGPGISPTWIATTACSASTTVNIPVATCTPVATANAGNNFTTTTCPSPIVTTNAPVAACAASLPTGGNGFKTTTCPAPITATTGVSSCTASSASLANLWTATTCPAPVVTTNVPVASCTASGANSGNGWTTTTCPAPVVTTNVPVASCTASGANSGNGWTTTTCPAPVVTTNVPVASCTASAANSGNSFTSTTCSSNNSSVGVAAGSCAAQAKLLGNYFTQITCTPQNTGPTAVASCTPGTDSITHIVTTCSSPLPTTSFVATCTNAPAGSGNSYQTTTCTTTNTAPPVPVPVASCVPTVPSSANNYLTTACTPVLGEKISVTTNTINSTDTISGTTVVARTAPVVTSGTPQDLNGICYTPGIAPPKPSLPTINPYRPTATQVPLPLLTSCTAWPCAVDSAFVAGGSSNSLADVAQYYYATDLRADFDNIVPGVGTSIEDDTATHQHMTTFGLGLGVSGLIGYQANYRTAATGVFADIRAGTRDWPIWPDAGINYSANPGLYNDPKSIDDFWHAAVNGRGRYFSAANPDDVVQGLGSALTSIDASAAAGGGAAISTAIPVVGDNFAFVTRYATEEWTGDLLAKTIDLDTGELSAGSIWSAQAKLDAAAGQACDNRKIYMRRSSATNGLAKFTWNTHSCDSAMSPTGAADTGLSATEQANFGAAAVLNLAQYAAMTDGSTSTVNQRLLAEGANLVNYVRGQRGNEGFTANTADKFYRTRTHVLADIVGSVATLVKAPNAEYADSGYAAFKTANANRAPMIYVGSNGGMLHAINAAMKTTDTNYAAAGEEAWAYVPGVLFKNLYRLADTDYKTKHRYFVDGTPSTGDVYDSVADAWKTILVGGLNAGGNGYYALDITDPATPKSLWEFNLSSVCSTTSTAGADCHVGLTFGRPVISKLVDGTWVVLVTSGYNNVRPTPGTGDGRGYLYVLNAVTGEIISKLDTGVGSPTSPAGLRDVNNYVANGALDNTTLRVYGGDLLGNVWRFDVNDNVEPTGKEATLVATAKDSSGTVQPITTRVQLAEINGSTMIFAATGKLMGLSDTSTTQAQSVYGFKDPLGSDVVHADLRGALSPISLTNSGTVRTAACTGSSASCTVSEDSPGWVLDLPDTGERVSVDPMINGTSLVFVSNIPGNNACEAGGKSRLNFVSLLSGLAPDGSPGGAASSPEIGSIAVGLNVLILPGNGGVTAGDGKAIAIVTGSDGTLKKFELPPTLPKPLGKRVSWREIKK